MEIADDENFPPGCNDQGKSELLIPNLYSCPTLYLLRPRYLSACDASRASAGLLSALHLMKE
jgi:hypothetical protein